MIRSHPKNYAVLIAADHSKSNETSSKRDHRGTKPSPGAGWLSQQRITQDLHELSKWVVINDRMVLPRKEIRLPHHRRDIEQDCQPCCDHLNGIAIAYAHHGDEISRPEHCNPGESERRHDLQKMPVDRDLESDNENDDDDKAVGKHDRVSVNYRIDRYRKVHFLVSIQVRLADEDCRALY